MRWLKQLFGPKHATELRLPGKLEFLAEQDGESERPLKERWLAVLRDNGTVLRAYLVRVTHDGGKSTSVMLAIRNSSGREDVALMDALFEPFRSLFSSQQFLDIGFLSEERENELRHVCPPFYTRAA